MNYSSTVVDRVTTLRQIWEKIDENSCPNNYNFHLHTTCSDGQLAPEMLVNQAINNRLKEMAITDHHSIQGYYLAQQYLIQQHKKAPHLDLPRLWLGVEITSDLQGTNVHLLAYDFDPLHSNLQVYFQGWHPEGMDKKAEIVIKRFHQAGGLVVLAHPFRYRRQALDLIAIASQLGIDGLEAYYAYDNPKPWRFSPKETQKAIAMAQDYNLFVTCGTDTHGSNILYRV
jgi:predicted metal-dependent phosphoesterase TrpH